jgi:hypothetical protein
MAGKLPKARGAAKTRRFPERNQNCLQGKQISPVMQIAKGLLAGTKSAQELQFLTGQPLSICQKTLSGHRAPNAAMYEALGATHLAAAAVVALIPADHSDPRIRSLRALARKIVVEQKAEREIAAIEAGLER